MKSIMMTFQSGVIRTLPRLRSVSRTSAANTRIRYIWLFQSVGFGGWIFCFSRSPSSISTSTHQLSEPSLPDQLRLTCIGIM